jgi:hypothetical protein
MYLVVDVALENAGNSIAHKPDAVALLHHLFHVLARHVLAAPEPEIPQHRNLAQHAGRAALELAEYEMVD